MVELNRNVHIEKENQNSLTVVMGELDGACDPPPPDQLKQHQEAQPSPYKG